MTTPSPNPQPSPERPPDKPQARTEKGPAEPSRTPPAVAQPPDWGYAGIDPELMHAFERDLGQAETTLGRHEPRIRRTLEDLDLDTSRLNALRELSNWISAKRPELRRREKTIQAVTTEWGTDTTGGLRPFDEGLYAGASSDPDAYAAAFRLSKVTRYGEVDEKTITELEKRTGDEQFATSLMYALGTERFRYLITALAYPGDAARKRLQAALGKTLGTASTRLNTSWRKELLGDLRAPVDQHGLADILQHGTFNRQFLVDTAIALETIDRKTWESTSAGALGDPMVSVWKALARDPLAAQQFLVGDPAVMQRYMTQRPTDDQGESFGQAIEAAMTTYRDRAGTIEDRSPGFTSALLAARFINLQGQLYREEKRSFTPTVTVTRILAAYANDVSRIAQKPAEGESLVYTASRRHLPEKDQVWGAQFNKEDLRWAMEHLFKNDPKALPALTAAQSAWAKQMLDHGAAQAASGEGRPALLHNAREAAAGFGMIADAGGLAKIKTGEDLDAERERNAKLLMAVVNTGLTIPKMTPWAMTADLLGAWTGMIEDSAKSETHANKATYDANTAKDQAKSIVNQLTIDAMLRHGLFGTSDPPGPAHPWSSLEGLDEGDDPRKAPNNFLKDDGRSLMTPKEMAPDKSDAQPRVDAYDRWLREGLAGGRWKELKNELDLGIQDGMSEFK